MAHINLLKPRQIATLPIGFHSDGSNLYLRVTSDTARSWIFRYMRNGKVRQVGLGTTAQRKIVDARDLADKMRRALADGDDPSAVLRNRDPTTMTFRAYAEELIAAKRKHFKSEKHGAQWPSTLERYVYPVIGQKRPDTVTLTDVESIIRPLWTTKAETAGRLRARIEAVLDYAYVAEGIEKRNPATLRGNLEHRGFESRRKIAPVVHHPAVPYSEMPDLMVELRAYTSTTAYCLRFTILTWTRSTEARAARWSELGSKHRLWTIPAHRMKTGKEHEVPLCEEACEILDEMAKRRRRDTDLIFAGARGGVLSDVGINKVLHSLPVVKRLDEVATANRHSTARNNDERGKTVNGATVHGMRSAARSWAAAKTNFQPFVLELALAHVNKDKVEAAYQRDSVLEKRAELMKAWGDYCRNSTVIPFVKHVSG